jgi:hypothetical protein
MGRGLFQCKHGIAPGVPAWLASVVAHGSIFLGAWLLLKDFQPPGVVAEPSREAGIVLKQVSDEGPLFAGEHELAEHELADFDRTDLVASESPLAEELSSVVPTESRQASVPIDPLIGMLPSAAELASTGSSMLDSLPQADLHGPASLPAGEVAQAADRTMGGAPGKQVGGEATVRLFGVEGVGTRFVYLFDRSVSMEGPLLAAAKQQLIASLESLESVHQFQILFFNYQVRTWDITGGQNRIPFATERNRRLAGQFVRGITAEGGTLRREALRRALLLRPDALFFLTDTDNPMAAGDVSQSIELARRNGTAIHAIEFGFQVNPERDNFLVRLARGTGGQYAYVDTARLGRGGVVP